VEKNLFTLSKVQNAKLAERRNSRSGFSKKDDDWKKFFYKTVEKQA